MLKNVQHFMWRTKNISQYLSSDKDRKVQQPVRWAYPGPDYDVRQHIACSDGGIQQTVKVL